MLGTLLTVAGCSFAILGGCLLFQSAASDTGEEPDMGKIPEFFRNRRQALSKFGFGFLTLGSTLQMMGALISGFFSH